MKDEVKLVGVFPYVDDFLSCLRDLKAKGYSLRAFSPVRLPEVDEVLYGKLSPVRLFTLIGGIVGGSCLVILAVWAHLSFRLIVWGKPVLPWIPWVVVAFEGTILIASLTSFISWVFNADLPRPGTDVGYETSFSGDRFGIVVSATSDTQHEIERILREKGAEEVRDVIA